MKVEEQTLNLPGATAPSWRGAVLCSETEPVQVWQRSMTTSQDPVHTDYLRWVYYT